MIFTKDSFAELQISREKEGGYIGGYSGGAVPHTPFSSPPLPKGTCSGAPAAAALPAAGDLAGANGGEEIGDGGRDHGAGGSGRAVEGVRW